jgi:hypothetical protein
MDEEILTNIGRRIMRKAEILKLDAVGRNPGTLPQDYPDLEEIRELGELLVEHVALSGQYPRRK